MFGNEDIRPDKILEHRLLLLVLILTLTIVSIGFLFAYPMYLRPVILSVFVLITLSILITIKILQSGETAILYGGLANEILKNRKICYTIVNMDGKTVIQNELAKEFLKKQPILSFLEQHLVEGEGNRLKLKQLETAAKHLKEERVECALRFDMKTVFSGVEWYRVTLRPISLNKKMAEDIKHTSAFDLKYNVYLLWSFENITAEKLIDDTFQEEKSDFYNFLHYMPVGIFVINKQNKITYVNQTFCMMLNTPQEKILDRKIDDFLFEITDTVQNLPNGGRQYIGYLNGEKKREYLVKMDCFKDGADMRSRGTVIGSIPTDASLKQAYTDTTAEANSIFNFSPFGIMLLDLDLVIKRVNQHFIDILGVPSASQLLNNYLMNYLDEDSVLKVKRQVKTFVTEESNLTPAYFDLNIKDKNRVKMLRLYICPLFSSLVQSKENLKGIVLFCLDTTEQKNLETQFAQAQKMQAMGQLAGGVAHDFNNLLTAMIGFCDLLLQNHSKYDSSYPDLIEIKKNATCAAALVKQLLQFSKKQPLQPELNNITDILVDFLPLLKRAVGEQIDLKFRHGENLDYVWVDKVQLLQVVLNLCVNARDAMDKKGTLTISTQMETLLEPYQFGAEVIDKGTFVRMDITDTGCGIPLENMSRIFEPFFSTKQNVVGSGTGLGLATVYGIVRQMDGFIKVKSTLNVGTTFSVYLPAHQPDPAMLTKKNDENLSFKRTLKDKRGHAVLTPVTLKLPEDHEKVVLGLSLSETPNQVPENVENIRILMVDDENSVRTFAMKALRKKGYEVVGCNSAENALDTLKTDTNFQLMITDMVMPGLNGVELATRVVDIIPDIKIILASGYSEDILKGEFNNIESLSFIPKPFSLNDLTKKVYEVLKS